VHNPTRFERWLAKTRAGIIAYLQNRRAKRRLAFSS
jgi:hypothetical protein